ncbi:50S ribosomal protein L13 [Candidatus Uhrbacteria bacterium RIFCSPHIGHO2_12_FULL_54_23]|uniref:Large ribosomal subunit protein uL13 n=3 Tax=Candidatus Uhriibacteriota TaxID=1752732 RepID=A0A1F7UMM1_9BACT|nr:MAG: 50S ribosomal protein L13 [Candidatus Uhrbacteria bacterium RIFCSPHIGHO2_12_FULL_54_23]OGL84538.1 MAG: 50S ribosomal protein L13 [Candidatus Uhrbacteria bacterium RIFCSPLOWO2_01_FULL_55_36]OGL90951.1 MAG: 50S ribosomal protein L13 [Candidatus Uhrbacteria bacterium RIFCSPLOWO2_02_FULL_54_37]
MKNGLPRETITLDASGKSLGRLATETARFLQGKHAVTWSPNIDAGARVVIQHLRKAKFTGSKMTGKIYYRHTNYPGNMKTATLKEKWEKRPGNVFHDVVSRMLPKNKLRKEMLKRLTIEV